MNLPRFRASLTAGLLLILGVAAIPGAIAAQEPKPDAARERAAALLAKARKALGGDKAFASIRDITRASDLVHHASGGRTVQRWQILLPGTVRQTSGEGAAALIAFTDGKQGWMKAPWGVDKLPPWQLRAAAQDLFRHLETLLQSDSMPGRTIAYQGEEALDKGRGHVVRIRESEDNQADLVFDAATGEPVKIRYTRVMPKGRGANVEEEYKEYRPAGPLRMPHAIVASEGGNLYMDTVVREITYNTGLKAEDLARQP